MGCLLAIIGALSPRLLFVIIWIARPAYVDAVFDTFIFPLLGVIFLPFGTLMWVLLDAPPLGIHGWDVVLDHARRAHGPESLHDRLRPARGLLGEHVDRLIRPDPLCA